MPRATARALSFGRSAYARDLGSFQSDTRHQAALTERKGIDVLRCRGGGHAARKPAIDNHNAGAGTNRPAIASLQVVERGIVHEEQGVAEGLYTRLQSIGPSADTEGQ